MSYVVNWREADGQTGWYPVADLDEAAAQVEHLRNDEGVDETKIFELREVAFELKPYYRVELGAAAAPAADPASAPDSDPVTPAWPDSAVVADALADVGVPVAVGAQEADAGDSAANGQRRGLFGR